MGIERASGRKRYFHDDRRRMLRKATIFSLVGLMLLFGAVSNNLLPAAYAATSTLTVEGFSVDGKPLNMWIVIQSNGSTIATGFTPMTFEGNTGSVYSVVARDYLGGSVFFDHWENGSKDRTRTLTLNSDTTFTAYYNTPDSKPLSHILTVNAYDQNNNARNMYTTIREGSTIVKTGFTPVTYEGNSGTALSVTVADYRDLVFDHWEDSSTTRTRIVSLSSDVTITAHYNDNAALPPPPPPPDNSLSAVDDTAATEQGKPVTINVLANDSYADDDPATVISVTSPTNGTATNNGDGNITYVPDSGFSGTDSFEYTISNGKGDVDSATVTVTVNAIETAEETTPILEPEPSAYTLTVSSADMAGDVKTGMYTVIREGGTIVKTGFTPLTYTGTSDKSYTATVSDYGSSIFDHWEDGSTIRTRALNLDADTTIVAHYRVPTLKLSPTSGVANTNVTVEGTFFSPNSAVTITYDAKTVSFATANAAGSFTTSFNVPTSGAGLHTVTATDARGWKSSASFEDVTEPVTHSLEEIIPKTGVMVALYMYPGSTGSVHWQKVIDEKKAHPSVPIVAIFNPSSGPGSSKDNNIASWVSKLQNAGVIAIGYVADKYGGKSLNTLKSDVDKYRNWYRADGIFIDEFPNKTGYESRYSELTRYAKAQGMKLTVANPGTDVPPSYIGRVDVINTSEGPGYISTTHPNIIGSSWVSGGYSGWHKDHDKRNFSVIRYDAGWLNKSFVTEVSKSVGLMYITNGNDSNKRWFHVPPYFGDLVATLDR